MKTAFKNDCFNDGSFAYEPKPCQIDRAAEFLLYHVGWNVPAYTGCPADGAELISIANAGLQSEHIDILTSAGCIILKPLGDAKEESTSFRVPKRVWNWYLDLKDNE